MLIVERCPKDLDGTVEVFDCKCYQFREKEDYWNDAGAYCSKHDGALG